MEINIPAEPARKSRRYLDTVDPNLCVTPNQKMV